MAAPRPPHVDRIEIIGANENNLQDISLALPRNRLVVITGLSGSGKSSVAFDTIYQEGQRRFLESLSSYARQFLGRMEKPRVERVDGLSPTLCIDQKTRGRNPRSTVGTVTEILDHLRLLMARLGTPRCPVCERVISTTSPGELADAILRDHPGARLQVLAPIVSDRKGEYRRELADALANGYLRARIDGRLVSLEDEELSLARYEKHTIELVLDRLRARPESRGRLVEAIERAVTMTSGVVSLLVARAPADRGFADRGPANRGAATRDSSRREPARSEGWQHRVFSADRSCPEHGISIPEMEPRLFSFNAPQGRCEECDGMGWLEDFDQSLLIDPNAPAHRALRALNDEGKLPFSHVSEQVIRTVARSLKISLRKHWRNLTPAQQSALLTGASVRYTVQRESGGRTVTSKRTWAGFLPIIRHVWRFGRPRALAAFRRRVTCPACAGQRLCPVARAVRFRDRGIVGLSSMTVEQAQTFFGALCLAPTERQIGTSIVSELRARLLFLSQVGLGYLGLDRPANTLSGGEAQRIRLARQVGAGLQGITYVLDEPSIGLHGRDQDRLLEALVRLRDQGNSVVVVEHDAATMARADYLVEIGPGAGSQGGQVVAAGTPRRFLRSKALTARYLRGEERIRLPEQRRVPGEKTLVLRGARQNNLKDVTLTLPLNCLSVVTGVSGSGKSSLVDATLCRALEAELHGAQTVPGTHDGIDGIEHLDKVLRIDQSPIGRTPRSNPATYTDAWGDIRNLFAALPLSRARGYVKGRFSFNVVGGRCEECHGAGVRTIEMQFLADVQVPCEACCGRRYDAETLEVRYRGKSIDEILAMPISEAREFFHNHLRLRRILQTLVDVGLSYLTLGQPSTTLSGGEAQRIKLAKRLARPTNGHALIVLDEPTTGLHMEDVKKLLVVLQRLVDAGNTVLIIEHNTDVIKVADRVIDMGPEGGAEGGRLVGQGTPEAIAALDTPTGRLLAEVLAHEAALDAAETVNAETGAAQVAETAPAYLIQPTRRSRRPRKISLRGVRTHNLDSVDVDLPLGCMTVITGPSGSGKSSLAFHTLFAEGQRRYVESLSTYARRFLGQVPRAPLTSVEGLAPAISINQKGRGHNPRSTVATVTEIYDLLRLLFARLGRPHCPTCGLYLQASAPSAAARRLAAANPGTGWLLASLPPTTPVSTLIEEGFQRALGADGREVRLETLPDAETLAERALVIDRLNPRTASRARLS